MVRESRRYAAAKQRLAARAGSSSWREAALGLVLASPPVLALVLLIIIPAVEAVLFSIGQVPADNVIFSTGLHLITSPTPTLEVYRKLFSAPFFQADLSLTFSVTILSVLFVVLLSYVLALYVRFGEGTLPEIVRSLYLIPMFVPVVIASYALITSYVDHGLLQAILFHVGIGYLPPIYNQTGIVLGEVWTSIRSRC